MCSRASAWGTAGGEPSMVPIWMKPIRRSSGERPSAALDVLVVGVGAGQPFGAEALCVRRQQNVLDGGTRRQDLLDLRDLGVLRIELGGDRDQQRGAERPGALLLERRRGRIRLALQKRLCEHLAQADARRAADHDEAPGSQPAVVGRARSRGQHALEGCVIRRRLAQERRCHRLPRQNRVERIHHRLASSGRGALLPRRAGQDKPRRPPAVGFKNRASNAGVSCEHLWCCSAASGKP